MTKEGEDLGNKYWSDSSGSCDSKSCSVSPRRRHGHPHKREGRSQTRNKNCRNDRHNKARCFEDDELIKLRKFLLAIAKDNVRDVRDVLEEFKDRYTEYPTHDD